MKKIFLTFASFSFAVFILNGCGSDSVSTNRNNAPSNANSAVVTSNNANISNNSVNSAKTSAGEMDEFMTKAAQAGIAEVELGKLASGKAQNADVKKFAQTMVQDHTNAGAELKALAAKKNVVLPAETDAEHKTAMEKMKTLSGADFDKAYVQAMVDDHKKAVDLFGEQSIGATDPDVKAFATKTLPTLKKHLDMIYDIQSKMK